MVGFGRVENLRYWQPGQSGNPAGRAKKPKDAYSAEEILRANAVRAANVMRDALRGKKVSPTALAAARDVLDRVLGKAPQAVAISFPDLVDQLRRGTLRRDDLMALRERYIAMTAIEHARHDIDMAAQAVDIVDDFTRASVAQSDAHKEE